MYHLRHKIQDILLGAGSKAKTLPPPNSTRNHRMSLCCLADMRPAMCACVFFLCICFCVMYGYIQCCLYSNEQACILQCVRVCVLCICFCVMYGYMQCCLYSNEQACDLQCVCVCFS
jgi:hypothetical protein